MPKTLSLIFFSLLLFFASRVVCEDMDDEDEYLDDIDPPTKIPAREFLLANCMLDSSAELIYPLVKESSEIQVFNFFAREPLVDVKKVHAKIGSRRRFVLESQWISTGVEFVRSNIDFFFRHFILSKNKYVKLKRNTLFRAPDYVFLTWIDGCVYNKQFFLLKMFDEVGYLVEYLPYWRKTISKLDLFFTFSNLKTLYAGMFQLTRAAFVFTSAGLFLNEIDEKQIGADTYIDFVIFKFSKMQKLQSECVFEDQKSLSSDLQKRVWQILDPKENKELQEILRKGNSLCMNSNVYLLANLFDEMANVIFPQGKIRLASCVGNKDSSRCPPEMQELFNKHPKLRLGVAQILSLNFFRETENYTNYAMLLLDVWGKLVDETYSGFSGVSRPLQEEYDEWEAIDEPLFEPLDPSLRLGQDPLDLQASSSRPKLVLV